MADVNKSLFAGSDFNECAEAHKTGYNARINRADFRVVCDCFDHCESAFCVIEVDSGNINSAVLFNVNLTVAFSANLLNNLALLTDDVTDFLGINLGRKHLRSIF